MKESVDSMKKEFDINSREEFPPLNVSIKECKFDFSFLDEEGKMNKEDIIFLGNEDKEDINLENKEFKFILEENILLKKILFF